MDKIPYFSSTAIEESEINIISSQTVIKGNTRFDQITKVYGSLFGEVESIEKGPLILGESAVVEGSIRADIVVVEGYVKGEIIAKRKVHITGTGRVEGQIQSPSLLVDFGAYLDGSCRMDESAERKREGGAAQASLPLSSS